MMGLKRGDWLLLAAAALAYFGFLPVRWAVEKSAGCAFIAPDMNFPPDMADYADAKSCLTGNGGAGLEAYVGWHLLGLDLVFPAMLAVAATVILLRVGETLPRFDRLSGKVKLAAAAVLPAAYALADYCENWTVAQWLKSGDDALLPLISALTTLKFAALAIAAMVAIAMILSALRHKRLS
ncbi:MAG: hypothetical protein WCC66_00395 [Rhizobiaceae bacterium]